MLQPRAHSLQGSFGTSHFKTLPKDDLGAGDVSECLVDTKQAVIAHDGPLDFAQPRAAALDSRRLL